jgi:urease accessory protein
MTLLAQTRLLQMASQAFPIGGYSHSQGLESAIEAGLVTDEASAQRWILDVLRYSLGSYELPLLRRMGDAWSAHLAPSDAAGVAGTPDTLHTLHTLHTLNADHLASRESAELRRASVQMGYSLRALLEVLPGLPPGFLRVLGGIDEPSLPLLWSGVAEAWCIQPLDSMLAYAWVWAENQVLVAMKSVPIGQSAGQRILLEAGARIARDAARWAHDELPWSNFAPGLAILSCRHETQYSRLFRS